MAYNDDIQVKSKNLNDHLDDVEETLDTMSQYGMRLNPSKCSFGRDWVWLKPNSNPKMVGFQPLGLVWVY